MNDSIHHRTGRTREYALERGCDCWLWVDGHRRTLARGTGMYELDVQHEERMHTFDLFAKLARCVWS